LFPLPRFADCKAPHLAPSTLLSVAFLAVPPPRKLFFLGLHKA